MLLNIPRNDLFLININLPNYEFWTDLSIEQYNQLKEQYKHRLWNFQIEVIKYCKLDCKVLHEILVYFNSLIFNHFSINVHTKHILTLPSLAMRIFKAHFMPENTIYQLLGNVEMAIRESYTGGAVDVYKPHNFKSIVNVIYRKIRSLFTKLYYYDVNSLYPYVMAYFDMPIGKPTYFEGISEPLMLMHLDFSIVKLQHLVISNTLFFK
jgi:hypothetical protein